METKKKEQRSIIEWLKQRNVTLTESFTDALTRMAKEYKEENGLKTLNEIYREIGVSKECLHYWGKNPYGVQTKKIQI